jgi:hypothetical protein
VGSRTADFDHAFGEGLGDDFAPAFDLELLAEVIRVFPDRFRKEVNRRTSLHTPDDDEHSATGLMDS